MTFSPQWNDANPRGDEMGMQGPMALMLHFFVGHLKGQRVLELGCGAGKAAKQMIEQGVEYYGIDGRDESIRKAALIEGAHVHCGDFTKEQPFEGGFDIVMDRASVPHNDLESIERCVWLIWSALKPGGLYVSSDWFSSHHSEVWRGDVVDGMTRNNYPDGQFHGVGNVHFSSERELCKLFAPFERRWLEERLTRRPMRTGFLSGEQDAPWISPHYGKKEYTSAVWDLLVRKPK